MPNSFLEYTADGADTKTGIAIPTFKKEEIKVRVDGVLKTEGSGQDYEINPYSTSSFTINWKDTARPTSPSVVRVYRQTDILNAAGSDVEGRATYQAGSSVKAGDLNDNQKQALRALEEENEHLLQSWDIQDNAIITSKIKDGAVTSAKILDGTIVNADINASAEIEVSKLKNGTTRQVLITAANGTDVAWASNIELPGTLDVNGVVDFDQTLNVDGATTIGGTLGITGTTTAAAINASGAVNVTGNLAINSNKFNVNATSGDTTVAGTLGVTGNATLNGGGSLKNIRVGITADNEIDTSTGNLTLDSAGGTVTIDDNLTVNGDLSVSGTFNADTLDSLDSTQFLRSDAVDTFTGGSLTIADNKILNIGSTGGGFQLTRDTTGGDAGMYVTDTGYHIYYAGTQGSTFRTGTNHKDVAKLVNYTDGGSRCKVELYEGADSSATPTKRLETTSTGVTITGELKTTSLEIGGADVTATSAELNILDQATVTTSELNKLDGYTGDVNNLNIVSGMTKTVSTDTFPTTSDTSYPTAKAINTHVVGLINDVGGFVPIANEVSFPTTNPDPDDGAGTIVSIADAGGLKVADGSGSGTYAGTAGHSIGATTTAGVAVTITDIDTSLRGTTIAAGKGMLVQTTTTLNTYTYHRLTLDEAGVASAQTLVSDFNERYRVHAGEPGSNNDEGDLVYDTNADKMKVYDSTTSAWKEVTSAGDFKLLTVVPDGATSGSPVFNGSNVSYDLRDGSSAASVNNVGQLLVSLNGVIQKPNSGTYNASNEGFYLEGTNGIKFCTAPIAGSSLFVTQIGSAVALNHPAADSVVADSIDDGAISNIAISSSANIAGSKLADDSIAEVKLDIHNAPSGTDKFLAYTSNGMEWAVPVGGATGVDFNDGVKARFGTDNDLELYHSGSHGIIKNDTGNLYLYAKATGNEVGAAIYPGAQVELYHNNIKTFETDANGVIVQGPDAGDAIIYLYADRGDDNADKFKISTSSAGGFWLENKVSGSWETNLYAAGNGAVELYNDNLKKFETTTNGIQVTNSTATAITVVSADNQDGGIYFNDGANQGAVLYQHNGDYMDFRTNGTEKVRIDSSGNVGINCTPSRELHVKGLDGTIRLESTAATGRTWIEFFDTSAIKGSIGYPSSGNDNLAIQQSENADMYFTTNDLERLRIKSDGDVQITDGNLIVADTHGISFAATADGGSVTPDELLDDYEEGEFVPDLGIYSSGSWSTATFGAGTKKGFYTKVGNLVHVQISFHTFHIDSSFDNGYVRLDSLPFTSKNNAYRVAVLNVTNTDAFTSADPFNFYLSNNATNAISRSIKGTGSAYAEISGTADRMLRISGCYATA